MADSLTRLPDPSPAEVRAWRDRHQRTLASRAHMSVDPVRQAYKRRMELIDRVSEACVSGGLTSEALEKFAAELRLIESEIRLDKASSSQFRTCGKVNPRTPLSTRFTYLDRIRDKTGRPNYIYTHTLRTWIGRLSRQSGKSGCVKKSLRWYSSSLVGELLGQKRPSQRSVSQ